MVQVLPDVFTDQCESTQINNQQQMQATNLTASVLVVLMRHVEEEKMCDVPEFTWASAMKGNAAFSVELPVS